MNTRGVSRMGRSPRAVRSRAAAAAAVVAAAETPPAPVPSVVEVNPVIVEPPVVEASPRSAEAMTLVAGARALVGDVQLSAICSLYYDGADLAGESCGFLRDFFASINVGSFQEVARTIATSPGSHVVDVLKYGAIAAAMSMARECPVALWPKGASTLALVGANAASRAAESEGQGNVDNSLPDGFSAEMSALLEKFVGPAASRETPESPLTSPGVLSSLGRGPVSGPDLGAGPAATGPSLGQGPPPPLAVSTKDFTTSTSVSGQTASTTDCGYWDQPLKDKDVEAVSHLIDDLRRKVAGMEARDPGKGKYICLLCSRLTEASSLLRANKEKAEAVAGCSINELIAAGGREVQYYAMDLLMQNRPSCPVLTGIELTSAQLCCLTRAAAFSPGSGSSFDELQRVVNPGLAEKLGNQLSALDMAKAMATSISMTSLAANNARAVALRAARKDNLEADLDLFAFLLECAHGVNRASSFLIAKGELLRLLEPLDNAAAAQVEFESFLSNPYTFLVRFLNVFLGATAAAAHSGKEFYSPFDMSIPAQQQILASAKGQFVFDYVRELRRAAGNAEKALAIASLQSQFKSMASSMLPGSAKGSGNGKGRGGGGGGGGGAKSVPAAPAGAVYSFKDFMALGGKYTAPLGVALKVTATNDAVPMVRCITHERGQLGSGQFVSPASLLGTPGFSCASVNPGRKLVSIPGTRLKNGVSVATTLHCCEDSSGARLLHSFT